VFGTSCWQRKNKDTSKIKSLGLSLSVVKGQLFAMRTTSEEYVCNSIREGFCWASSMTYVKAFLKSLTVDSHLPAWLGEYGGIRNQLILHLRSKLWNSVKSSSNDSCFSAAQKVFSLPRKGVYRQWYIGYMLHAEKSEPVAFSRVPCAEFKVRNEGQSRILLLFLSYFRSFLMVMILALQKPLKK